MDDIYGNLDNYEDENRLELLENENLELKTKVISITNDITKLQAEYDFLKSEFDKMKANYSSLLKTAKAEIERKTKMISALNAEKDELIIGLINDSAHKRININRYKPKARTSMENSNKNLKEQPKCNTDTIQEFGHGQHQDKTPNNRKSTPQDQIVQSKDTKINSTSNTYNKRDCKENLQVLQHNERPTDQKSNKDVRQEQIKQSTCVTKRRKSLPALSDRSISPQCALNDEEEPTSTKSTLKHNSSEVPSREERLKQTKFYNRKYERNYDIERRKEQYESRYNRGRSPHDDRDSRRYGRNKFQERDFRNKYNNRPEYDRRRVLESPPPDLQRTRNRYRPQEHYDKPRYSDPDRRSPNQRCNTGYDGSTNQRQTRVGNRQADHMEEDNISAKFSEEEESSISTFTDDQRVNPEPDPRLFSNRYVEVYDNKNNVSTISTVRGRNVDLKLLKYDQNVYVERSSQVVHDCANDNYNSMRTEIRGLSVESGEVFEEPHLEKYQKSETSPLHHNVISWGQYKKEELHNKPCSDDRSSAHENYTNKMVMIPENEQYYDGVRSQKLSPEDISSTSVKNHLLNDLSLCPVNRTESKEQNVTSTSEVSEDIKLRSALLNKKVVAKFPHATKDIKRCHSVADDLELSDENSDCNDTMSPAKRDTNIEHDTSLGKPHKIVDENSLITLEDLDLPVNPQSKKLLDIEESPLPIICADSSKSDNSTEINDKGISVKEVSPKETIKTETKSSRKRKNKDDLISKDSKKSRSDAIDKKKCHKETLVPKADEESNRKRHKQTNITTSGKEIAKSQREKNSVSTPDDNPKKEVEKPKKKSNEDGGLPELSTEPKQKIKESISKKVEETEKRRREVSFITIPLDKEKTKKKRNEETSASEPKKNCHNGSSDPTKIASNRNKKVTNMSTTHNTKTCQQEQSVVESKKNIDDNNDSTKLKEPKKKRSEVTFVSTTEKPVATEPSVYKNVIENRPNVTADTSKNFKEGQSVVDSKKYIRDDNNDPIKLREPKKKCNEVTSVTTTENSVATTQPSVYKDFIENSGDVTANERLTDNIKNCQQDQSVVEVHDDNNDSIKLKETKKKCYEVTFTSTSEHLMATTEPSVDKDMIENSGEVSTVNEQVTLAATPGVSVASEINLSNNSSSAVIPIVNSTKPGNPPPDVRIVMKRRSRPIMRKPINAGP